MARFDKNPSSISDCEDAENCSSATTSPLSREQISKWAEMIAEGRDSFPDGLTAEEAKNLENAVRRRLRSRFLHLAAKAIAADFRNQTGPRRAY